MPENIERQGFLHTSSEPNALQRARIGSIEGGQTEWTASVPADRFFDKPFNPKKTLYRVAHDYFEYPISFDTVTVKQFDDTSIEMVQVSVPSVEIKQQLGHLEETACNSFVYHRLLENIYYGNPQNIMPLLPEKAAGDLETEFRRKIIGAFFMQAMDQDKIQCREREDSDNIVELPRPEEEALYEQLQEEGITSIKEDEIVALVAFDLARTLKQQQPMHD